MSFNAYVQKLDQLCIEEDFVIDDMCAKYQNIVKANIQITYDEYVLDILMECVNLNPSMIYECFALIHIFGTDRYEHKTE